MNCENNFCIYHIKGICQLDEISLDRVGMCSECIYPDLDEDLLTKAKLNLLKKYEQEAVE